MGPRARVRGHFDRGELVGLLLLFEWTGRPCSGHFGSIDRLSVAPSESAFGAAEPAGGGRRRASDPHLESSFRRRRSTYPPVHDLPRHVLWGRIAPYHRARRHLVHGCDGVEWRDVLLSSQRDERRRGGTAVERGFGDPEQIGRASWRARV